MLFQGSPFAQQRGDLPGSFGWEKFILSSTASSGRRVWIDLYETNLTEAMIQKLSQHIVNIIHKVSKMALVGCPRRVFKKIEGYLYRADCNLAGQIKCFKDPERSKD